MPPGSPRGGRLGGGVGLPGGLLLGLDGGLDGQLGELAHHRGGAPQAAFAKAAAGDGEVPLNLGEQAAGGDEAVGAQLGVVGQVQVDVHDASSHRAVCPSPGS